MGSARNTDSAYSSRISRLPVWLHWLDADASQQLAQQNSAQSKASTKLSRYIPFLFLHSGILLVFVTGFSWTAFLICAVLYWLRMFAITGFYHRYFSHRTFKTSRTFQFIMACIGLTSVQRGPLWWAAHHRQHHPHSDTEKDIHSPNQGLWWSHIGWIASESNMPTQYCRIKDFARFPELRFLNRFDWLGPLVLSVLLYGLGEWINLGSTGLPKDWQTNGLQLLTWGFFVSSILLFHATCTINSLSHVFGAQRYSTKDNSKNNWMLAIITMGEGWHNNHHFYPNAVRQGFFWWEFDLTYYLLRAMAALGLVWDLTPVPERIKSAAATTTASNYAPAAKRFYVSRKVVQPS
ncbi:MAG: acyl-CoA desaturase [Cyanobacteria bacterium P01_H01_bin.74]